VDALGKALAARDGTLREAAARALGHFGTEAKPAAVALLDLLQSRNAEVRKAAGEALAQAGEGKAALDRLREALKDEDGKLRAAAVHALGWMGPEAREALPELRQALRDADPVVRVRAAWALWEVDRQTRDTVPLLIQEAQIRLRQPPGVTALRMLGRMGPEAKAAVPDLLALMKREPDLGTRLELARTLGAIGPASREAVPALLELARDVHVFWGREADELSDHEGGREKPTFSRPLALTDADLRREARRVLAGRSDSVVPALQELLDNLTTGLGEEVVQTLARLGAPAVPALVKALGDADPVYRVTTAWALAEMGEKAGDAVPALREALKDREPEVRAHAARALWKADPELARDAVPVLAAVLAEDDPTARIQAARTLSEMGTEAGAAAPALKRSLRDREKYVRKWAALALGGVGPEA
jgi:HEAT repeat protein